MISTRFAAALLAVLMVALLGGTAGAMELSQGFAGIPWGSSVSDHAGLQPVGSKGKVDFYVNPEVVHTIGDVAVNNEVYGFYEGRFFAGYVNLESVEVFGRLKEDLTKQCGEPEISMTMKSQQTIYKWKLQGVKIKMKVRESTGEMKIAFYHVTEAGRLNEAELESHKEQRLRFLPIEKDRQPKRMPLLQF
jgi:hypothetical protein